MKVRPVFCQKFTSEDATVPPFYRAKIQHGGQAIAQDGEVAPIPEFCAMAYNIKIRRGVKVVAHEQVPPWEIEGRPFNLRVDVLKGEEEYWDESFFIVAEPRDAQMWCDRILALVNSEPFPPAPANKGPSLAHKGIGTPINLKANVNQVSLDLLKTEYPDTFLARRQLEKATSEEERTHWRKKVLEGFLSDYTRISGAMPPVDDANKYWDNSELLKSMAHAMESPRKLDAIAHELGQVLTKICQYEFFPE